MILISRKDVEGAQRKTGVGLSRFHDSSVLVL